MSVSAPIGGIVCAGRLYCDMVFADAPRLPQAGAEVFAGGLTLLPGGGAYITAAWAVAMGLPALLHARLPAAPFDAICRAHLRLAGVADGTVAARDGDDAQVTVVMPHQGDRAFLTRRAGPALPDTALPRGARHLHIGELATLAERPDLLDQARAAGMTISLDCGWDDVLPRDAAALIAAVDVFLPSEDEVARLAAWGIGEVAPLTVVKRGARGATSHGGAMARAGDTVPTVDATGAGDAFNAGYLAAWLTGSTPVACLDAGNRCGAAAVQGIGGTGGMPAMRPDLARMGAA